MALKFKKAKWFLSYWSEHYFDCFDDQNIILNLKITWPTKISMPFLSSLDNLL